MASIGVDVVDPLRGRHDRILEPGIVADDVIGHRHIRPVAAQRCVQISVVVLRPDRPAPNQDKAGQGRGVDQRPPQRQREAGQQEIQRQRDEREVQHQVRRKHTGVFGQGRQAQIGQGG